MIILVHLSFTFGMISLLTGDIMYSILTVISYLLALVLLGLIESIGMRKNDNSTRHTTKQKRK